jgi:hypothetical protein
LSYLFGLGFANVVVGIMLIVSFGDRLSTATLGQLSAGLIFGQLGGRRLLAAPGFGAPAAPFRRLDTFLPSTSGLQTVCLAASGRAVIVLARSRDLPDHIDVHTGTAFRSLSADTPAAALTDAARHVELLAQFLAHVIDQEARHAVDRQRAEADHRKVLDEIRTYAIDRHEEGAYCREGLNEFLHHFRLDRYPRQANVRFTIRGSYAVAGHDRDEVEADAEANLRLDLDGLGDLIEGSESFTVDVEGIDVDDNP